jgi:hypothetical protein
MGNLSIPKQFTNRYIASLKPREARYDITDATGMQVRITARGIRVFSVRWYQHSRTGIIIKGE